MARSSYCLYRYSIIDEGEYSIPEEEHIGIIGGLMRQKVPHRKREPTSGDLDTFLMRLREENLAGHDCAIFDVAKSIDYRVEQRYNERTDDLDLIDVSADDTHWTRFVLLPEFGRVGIKDGSGERLTADQGANRVKSVFRWLTEFDFHYEKTASASEVTRAASRLGLTEFSFTTRPTNPHPTIPGEKMDALLRKAKIGHVSGKAKPTFGKTMTAANDGFISETMGLSKEGYGQYGFKGTTNSGIEIAYKKPKYEPTREGNLRQREKSSSLKVIVQDDDKQISEEEFVVRAILEIYGDSI